MHKEITTYKYKLASELNQMQKYISSGGIDQAPTNLYDMIGNTMSKLQEKSYAAGEKAYELYSKIKNKSKDYKIPQQAKTIAKRGSIDKIPRAISNLSKATISNVSDANTAMNMPSTAEAAPSDFRSAYSMAEGTASAGSLAHEGTQAIKAFSPVSTSISPSTSMIGRGLGTVSSGLSRVAPWMWAGTMAMEGIDTAKNPQKAIDDATNSLEGKGALGRAWYGFTNPIKTIAATGRAIGDLVGSYTPSNNSGQQFIPSPQQNNIQQNSFLPKPTGSPQPMPSTQNSFLPKPLGTPQPIQKTSSQDKFTGLQTSVPNETPEALYGRIMSKNLNVDQFFNNAIKHDWKIPGVPGFLARTVARKAQQNPDPYLNSLRNKVQKSTIIDAIKRNPDAFKNVSNNTLNTTNIT